MPPAVPQHHGQMAPHAYPAPPPPEDPVGPLESSHPATGAAKWTGKRYVNGVYTGTHYLFTVRTSDGRTMKLDNRFSGVEAIGEAIVRASASTLLPRYRQALAAGQRVDFGPVAIDARGIYSGGKSAGWNEVKAVRVERGMLSVAKEGKWLSWSSAMVASIPNFFVLFTLLPQFTRVE